MEYKIKNQDLLKLLGRKWSISIIHVLLNYPTSEVGFNELKRNLDTISSKVLSDRLKQLVNENLIERKEYNNTAPRRVNYFLTDKGFSLCSEVGQIADIKSEKI